MQLTPEQNNAIAVRFFDSVWNKGDFSVLDELIHPEAVDHSTVGGKEKTDPGSGSFRQIVSMFRGAMPDVALTIHHEVFMNDLVVHRWSIKGTDIAGMMGLSATGKEITFGGTTVVRFRDGKIIERWANVDELGLQQQLGIIA